MQLWTAPNLQNEQEIFQTYPEIYALFHARFLFKFKLIF